MLSDKFIQQQKEELLKEKARIEKMAAKLKDYPDYGFDEEDNIGEISDYETNLSIDEQLELLLQKINRALKAIEDGTYGKCKKCKEIIEQGRLEIIPYADLCVTCRSQKK